MDKETGEAIIESIRQEFIKVKGLGEDAFYQLWRKDISFYIDPLRKDYRYDVKPTSIGIIMQHMIGNLNSRFTDFLTTDGEKSWRDRDKEFIPQHWTNEELIGKWNEAWMKLFQLVAVDLKPEDLMKTVYIRKEPMTVIEALFRQMTHHSYHAGQIVFLAKEFLGDEWETLSIPLGKSAEYLTKAPKRKERE